MLKGKDILAFLIWFVFMGLVAYGLLQLTAGRGPAALATATPAATAPATAAPSPGGTPVPPDAALAVWRLLAQQLQADPAEVSIASFQPVDWPDACLGVEIPGRVCAEVVTPGYIVVLKVAGRSYEYHTDMSGEDYQLASAPEPDIPDVAVVWTSPGEPCRTARIGSQAVAFGACGGVLMEGRYVPGMDAERQGQYRDFTAAYAPFKAETPAGSVEFSGQGAAVATAAEQRMIAEWARLVALEAEGGRSGASYGLVLAWHREGGLKGFCDDLEVYADGRAYATSCKGGTPQELGRRRLTADELAQVFAWVDAYKSFEYGHKDPATVDAMTVRLVFSGAGAGEVDPQPVLDFAATLYQSIAVP